MKELRIDSITNDIVVFAEDRLKRPIDECISKNNEDSFSEYEEDCPFCKGNEFKCGEDTFRIEDDNGWLVRSIHNLFPITDLESNEIYGTHEVMIDINRHEGNFYNMDEYEFENLFRMYKNRYINLIKRNKVEYVSIFKNYLRKAGASLAHPHSQIVSLPFVPPEIENEILISKNYYDENNKCLYENIIKEEIELNQRVIYNGESFLVIVPYATKYTGEVRILFKEKIGFDKITDDDIKELSTIFKKLFDKIYYIDGNMPFNLYIHTYPTNIECSKYFNTHIHIIPRKYSFGGFELGTGIYVSSRKPEDLAKKLKF